MGRTNIIRVLGIVTLLTVGVILSVAFLVRNWPFSQQAVIQALQDRFARQVEIREFHRTYFPPGCVANGVVFLHRKRKDLPPLISVQSLRIRGSYAGLFRLHKSVPQIQVVGLYIVVPPKNSNGGGSQSVMPLTNSTSGKQLGIDELTTEDAVLEFLPDVPGKEPFRLQIHRLRLGHVGENDAIPFHAALLNTEPPGEIESDGRIGPWNEDEPGITPVSGSYIYEHVNLGVFEGVAGTLSSRGTYQGTLAHLGAEGEIDVPNFGVSTGGNHTVDLGSNYKAVVNATNGDTFLQSVQSVFRRTTITSKGAVGGRPGRHGKTTELDMTVKDGRIEDLLYLFDADNNPSMTGAVTLNVKAEMPPGPPGFLTKLILAGDMGVGGGRFTNRVMQDPVNRLVKSAQGETKTQEEEDPATALSNLRGRVTVKNGIATLSNTSFTAPDTFAEIGGTYNLLDKTIDLRGVLHTHGKLSETTTGFKAIVLKGLGPFLKKKTITIVPFTIKGTSAHPVFALDLDAKRRL